MKNQRKGNDIIVSWSLFNNETPFIINRSNAKLYLTDSFSKTELKDFAVVENIITWRFFGKDQKRLGVHYLTLVINESKDNMITVDSCGFVNIVENSCEVGGLDNPNVETDTIELTSTIEYVAGEGGSYDDTEIRNQLTELSAELGNKQDTISDLENIREGAKKGATALQSVPEAYATKEYVANLLGIIINGDY